MMSVMPQSSLGVGKKSVSDGGGQVSPAGSPLQKLALLTSNFLARTGIGSLTGSSDIRSSSPTASLSNISPVGDLLSAEDLIAAQQQSSMSAVHLVLLSQLLATHFKTMLFIAKNV